MPTFELKNISVDITPIQCAILFSQMDNDEQAVFFTVVADEIEKFKMAVEFQLQSISNSSYLSDNARSLMDKIGQYAHKQQ